MTTHAVSPELLAAIEERCSLVEGRGGDRMELPLAKIRALVARIRELESEQCA